MRATKTDHPTPRSELAWAALKGVPALVDGTGFQYVVEGTFREGYPVFVSRSSLRSSAGSSTSQAEVRLFRKGNKWYDSWWVHGEGFTSNGEADHNPAGDPNLPPTGRGWHDSTTRSNLPFELSLLDSFNLLMTEMQGPAQQKAVAKDDIKTFSKRVGAGKEQLAPLAVDDLWTRLRAGKSKHPAYAWCAALNDIDVSGVWVERVATVLGNRLRHEVNALGGGLDSTSLRDHLAVVLCVPMQQVLDTSDDKKQARWLDTTLPRLRGRGWWYDAAAIKPVEGLLKDAVKNDQRRTNIPALKKKINQILDRENHLYSPLSDSLIQELSFDRLTQAAETDENSLKTRLRSPPSQPGAALPGIVTVTDIKCSAVSCSPRFRMVMQMLTEKFGVKTIFPPMKSAWDILRKALRQNGDNGGRIDCRGVLDVNRVVLVCKDSTQAYTVFMAIRKSLVIQIRWMRSRLETPTIRGWRDLLLWITFDGGDKHVCEIRIVFECFMSAQSETDAVHAIATIRDGISLITAAGGSFERVDASQAIELAAANLEMESMLKVESEAKRRLEKANRELKEVRARLESELHHALNRITELEQGQMSKREDSAQLSSLASENQRLRKNVEALSARCAIGKEHELKFLELSEENARLRQQLKGTPKKSTILSTTSQRELQDRITEQQSLIMAQQKMINDLTELTESNIS